MVADLICEALKGRTRTLDVMTRRRAGISPCSSVGNSHCLIEAMSEFSIRIVQEAKS